MNKFTKKEIESRNHWDQVSFSRKNNTVTIYSGFFYSSEERKVAFWDLVKKAFPEVAHFDCSSQWTPFNGGASCKTSSHYSVTFSQDKPEVK